jgi:DNA ligase 1
MLYPVLYTKDSLNKTRIWFMEQEENKYRTISGIIDGEQVTSDWTVVSGKNIGRSNETTATDQATKEIEAKYKKQEKTGYFRKKEDIDKQKYISPMLAKNLNDYKDKIDYSQGYYGIQCKFNGVRCVATKNGLFSRTGEEFLSVPHITESLKKFFDENPEAVLDGELFNSELREELNLIIKLTRKTVKITQEDLDKSKEIIEYFIYDGFDCSKKETHSDSDYIVRKQWIDDEVKKLNSKHIKIVNTFVFSTVEDLERHYNNLIEQRHEGGIIRNLCSPYEFKRSKNLLKIKPENDAEFEITGISEGQGNWSGKAKIISLKSLDKTPYEFNATFKGSMEDAEECLKNKDNWIGKVVTIKYNGFTGLGVPNYAQFDYRNCIKEATP